MRAAIIYFAAPLRANGENKGLSGRNMRVAGSLIHGMILGMQRKQWLA